MNARTLACMALLVAGCVNTSAETGPAPTQRPSSAAKPSKASAPVAVGAVASVPSLELVARPHAESMREVALSPDGEAALSLDTDGGVRLWTSYGRGAVPFALPVQEPLWMSLARTEGGYLAAFIDTSGGAHVGRIAVSGGAATWTTAFDVPPMDPMFELHVLPGGERILALGVDHRVRLWDAQGNTVAELDEHGVIPWQLRVEHDDAGVHAAVVQFGPVRIQRLEVRDDGLQLVGEPHAVAIDQSPNRNDIGMSADGRYATAMQKRDSKSSRFEVEVIDLTDGSRRMLAADSDTRFRPRIHAQADAVIAETGSGAALRLPLDAAVPWQPGQDREALAPVQPTTIAFASSKDFSMAHATVRGGKRALAWHDGLHVQSIDGSDALAVPREAFRPTAVALDQAGRRVAWGTPEALMVESVGGDDVQTLAPIEGSPGLMAFAGPDHLVAVGSKGDITVRELSSDAVVDSKTVSVGWGLTQTGWRPGPDGGSLVLSDDKPGGALTVISVANGKLGQPVSVVARQRSEWPEGGKPRGMESVDWLRTQGMELGTLGLRPQEVIETVPQPGAPRSVVVQFNRSSAPWGEAHLSMVDDDKRVWAHDTQGVHDAAWSGDGTRFVFADRRGGFVLDAQTGSVVYERRYSPVPS